MEFSSERRNVWVGKMCYAVLPSQLKPRLDKLDNLELELMFQFSRARYLLTP